MKISSAKFRQWTNAICIVFPGEKEFVYYKPFTASISANIIKKLIKKTIIFFQVLALQLKDGNIFYLFAEYIKADVH